MSLKAQTLITNLGNPLNTHNFVVYISNKDFEGVQILVSSTTFVTEVLQEYLLYFQGEKVRFPSIPDNGGEWTCQIPEGELAKFRSAYIKHYSKNFNQTTGAMTHWSITDKFTIDVYARSLRGDVDGSDKLFGVKLHGCYMKGASPVNLNNSNPTQNWVWDVRFTYDYIEDLEVTPREQ